METSSYGDHQGKGSWKHRSADYQDLDCLPYPVSTGARPKPYVSSCWIFTTFSDFEIDYLKNCSESNVFYLFLWKLQQIQWAQSHYLIEQILSYKTLFFNIVTISYAFPSAMNKSLHVALVKIYTSRGDPLLSPLLKWTTHHLTVHMSTVWSPLRFSKYQWTSVYAIFSVWRNPVTHSFVSSTLPCQMPFCQTAPLLPPVTHQ